MNEKSAEYFIPGEDQLDPEKTVINFNINDANIAKAKAEFKDVDAYKDMDGAKAAKRVLTKMRTTLAEAHKEQKAEALAHGRKLDSEKNRLLALIAEVEDPITEQLKDIKEKAEREEQERLDKIAAHIERLNSYAADRHDLNVEQLKERRANLAKEPLTEDIYQEQLGNAKLAHEEADTKLRIILQREIDAEQERAAAAKVAEENAAKQKELDERQAKMDAEDAERRRKQDAEDANRRAVQESEAAERRKKEKEEADARQAELDKQAAEQAAAQKKIDDEKARIAKEQADKQEAEAKAAKAEEDKLAELAKAPDRDKLLVLVRHIEELVYAKPVMQSQEGANTLLFACDSLTELANTVRKCVEEMK